ncbi:MAG: hypothetical protein Q8P37_01860, partial [Candidatus Spechtbacteria bacterium]|nr:hypothetical protein [Candidatus Spechtbacteria bacterium]
FFDPFAFLAEEIRWQIIDALRVSMNLKPDDLKTEKSYHYGPIPAIKNDLVSSNPADPDEVGPSQQNPGQSAKPS